jgi:hypothetical protein
MWLLLGGKTSWKQVPGGRVASRWCAPCGAVTTYVECDVRDRVSAFFVTFVDATQRRMICVECHEDVSIEEAFPPAVAPAPRAPAPRAPAAAPTVAPDADALLAALKRKMGL